MRLFSTNFTKWALMAVFFLILAPGCGGCGKSGSSNENDNDPDSDPDFLCVNEADCDEDGVPATCDEDDADEDNVACVENPLPPGCDNATDCDDDGVSRVCDENDSDAGVTSLKPECVENNPACAIPLDCDADGLSNACDASPFDAAVVEIKKPECAAQDVDNDGFWDDTCSSRDANGDGALSSDEIANRVLCDNCVGLPNPDQADGNGDLAGDVCDALNCTDTDEDQVCDEINGVRVDNCPAVFNPIQTANLDGDEFGDACDDDRDGDGVTVAGGDCDDLNALRFPGNPAEDVIADGIDLNCDGNDLPENCLFAHPDRLSAVAPSCPFESPCSLADAVTAAGDDGKVCLYKGSYSGNFIIDKSVTFVPGFSCLNADGTPVSLIDMIINNACSAQTQMRKCNPLRDDGTLDDACLTSFEGASGGPAVTLTAGATLDSVSIKAHKCEVALKIVDSSPTVKNSLIESPVCVRDDIDPNDNEWDIVEDGRVTSQAVRIELLNEDTKPILTDNVIRAGEVIENFTDPLEELPFNTSAISGLALANSDNSKVLRPFIHRNEIFSGTSRHACSAISLSRLSYTGEAVDNRKGDNYRPSIKDNRIQIDACRFASALGFNTVPARVYRNTITVKGANASGPLNGLTCNGLVMGPTIDKPYLIYGNLLKVCTDTQPSSILGVFIWDQNLPETIENTWVRPVTRIYSNTIVVGKGSGSSSITPDLTSVGMYIGEEEGTHRIVNNIFMAKEEGTQAAIFIKDFDGDMNIVTLEYVANNLFDSNFTNAFHYNSGIANFLSLAGALGTLFPDTSAERIANNIEGQRPRLDDFYRTTALSPARDAGYRFGATGNLAGPTWDITNEPRGDNPDIGCSEGLAPSLNFSVPDFQVRPVSPGI